MKYLIAVCVILYGVNGKVLPKRVSSLLCSKSDAQYEECTRKNLEKAIPLFSKGIPESGLPPMDPLNLPVVLVNRTLNELVSINAVLRNVVITGMKDVIVEDLKANPTDLTAEIRVTLPWNTMEADYDVNGQILIMPLRSRGHFSGNFSDAQMYVKGSLKTVDRDGVKYFKIDKFYSKNRIGDGRVKLTADNPDLQFAGEIGKKVKLRVFVWNADETADLIANFYNDNPRRVMDAINPIYVEMATEFFRSILDQVLATAPAKEWLPE